MDTMYLKRSCPVVAFEQMVVDADCSLNSLLMTLGRMVEEVSRNLLDLAMTAKKDCVVD